MTPEEQAQLQTAINELGNDAPLVKNLIIAIKAKDRTAIAAMIPQLTTEARKDYEAVMPIIGIVKAGFKTSEFWLVTGVLVANVLYTTLSGKTLPLDVNATISGLVAVYTLIRGAIKKPTA